VLDPSLEWPYPIEQRITWQVAAEGVDERRRWTRYAATSDVLHGQRASFLGRSIGGPDDIHGFQGVARPGLMFIAGDQTRDEMPLGRNITIHIDLVVRRQVHRLALTVATRTDPL
jgi:hypothetical protein